VTSARTRAGASGTFVIADDGPSIQVAFPLEASAPTFGLDRPTRLLGAAALPPDALPSATGLDHVPGLRSLLANVCRRQVLAGRNWFEHSPIVLVGNAGFGRGLVVQRISELAGVPLVDVGGANLDAAAVRDGVALGDVPAPVLAMALTRCANPIVLLDLTETNPNPLATRRLTEMLDPTRAGRWLHERLRTVFDLSHVSWIVQAPRVSPAVAAIEDAGGRVINISAQTDVREDLRRLSTAQQVARRGGHGTSDQFLVGDILTELQRRFLRETPPGRSLWDHAVAFADERRGRA
jgi:hypothetical protein